jgi:hypothetical protein
MNRKLIHALTASAAAALLAIAADETNAPSGATNTPAGADATTNSAPPPEPGPSTNSPSAPDAAAVEAKSDGETDFSAFKIIGDRNIFNPNRVASRPERSGRNWNRPKPAESISLAGVMLYEKGNLAFFNASDPAYKKPLKVEGRVAGFKIASIDLHSVKLEGPTNEIELRVGMSLRKGEGGGWSVSTAPPEPAPSAETNAPDAAAAPGSANVKTNDDAKTGGPAASPSDVLKRLMERRKQQIKP